MGVLQRFERRLGGLVEGAFAKVFRGEVQPVEVAQALAREADDRKTVVAEGKVLVPNDYVVELGHHDHARLSPWSEPLGREFAAMVREHAAEQGYSFVGPVTVGLEEIAGIDTGAFRIRSGVRPGEVGPDGGSPVPAQAAGDRPASDAGAGALPGRPRLLRTAGEGDDAFYLTHPVTVVGRANDCDLRLDDPGVSRRHAELRVEADGVVLVDLGSTNGTRVNDAPAGRQPLHPGDRIELGSTTLVYQRDGKG